MFAHHRKRVQLLFAIADAVLTLLAFESAYYTRLELHFDLVFFLTRHAHVLLAFFCVVVWVALGWQQRLYEYLDSVKPARLIGHTFKQCLLGTMAVVLFQYAIRLDHPLSRGFLLIFFVYNFLFLAWFRWSSPSIVGIFQRGFGSPYHVVLVGDPEKTARLEQTLCNGSPFRIQISAILTASDCAREMPKLLSRHIVDEVIFDVPSDTLSQLEPVFLHCDEEGVRTRIAIDFFPHVNSEVSLDRVAGAPLLTFSAAPLDDLSLLVKRFEDIVVSALSLVVFSPVFLLVGLLVKVTSPGPVLFRQVRCGLNGRRFTMYKFRSMVENADEMKRHLEHLSEREIAFKMAEDPRVTSVGRFIRRYSIDEWPQFYNVLRGDMSIVGPRPPLPDEVDRYERWQKRRLRMRPGLTCLWAVMGRDKLDFNAWMRTDISYIDNWSLGLDWAIILRTIPHVLAGKGAH